MMAIFRFPSPTVFELCVGTAIAMLLLHSVGTLVGLLGVPAIDWTRANARPFLEIVILMTGLVAVVGSTALIAAAACTERVILFRRCRRVLTAAALVSVVLAAQMLFRFIGYQIQGLILMPVGGNMNELDSAGYLLMQVLLRAVLPIGTVLLLLVLNARPDCESESDQIGQ